MICENCRNQIPNNSTVCSFCNTPVRMSTGRVCPRCNTPLGESDTFCMGCGNKVVAETPITERGYEDRLRFFYDDRGYTRRRRGNGPLIALVAVLVFALIGMGAFMILRKDSTSTPVEETAKEENVLMLSVNDYESEVGEDTSNYVLSGKATATTEDATVSINGQNVQTVTAGGNIVNWSAQLSLGSGMNVFDVKLFDNSGNVEEHTVKITRKAKSSVITPAPTPTPAPDTYSGKSSGYLFASDTRYITLSDLVGLSKEQVALIRNEIYARHGYKFNTKKYQDYFNGKSWYHPRSNFSESSFNSIEKANKDFIVNYEKSMGWR